MSAAPPGGAMLACIVSPNPADADLAVAVLNESGIGARALSTLVELAGTIGDEAGCVVIVEEALTTDEMPALREALGRQPAWSDLPLVFIGRDVGLLGGLVADAFPDSGNVTLLERPLNPHTLVSAVQVALRASARQRQVGELLAEREDAVRLRDEFLAMLAHELRNPLAPIRNAAYVFRRVAAEDEGVKRNAEIVERQVAHVSRMLDDLLDVARLEHGKVTLQKERTDLNRLVTAGVETCLPSVHQRQQRINVDLHSSPLPVEADAVRIEQIVCNLITNASKFSPAGATIRISTGLEGVQATVAVEDEGVGFEPAAADGLFTLFHQASQTLERAAGGLGLGLTIVRRLAELHQGAVRAESEGPGKGARFTFALPVVASGVTVSQPAQGVVRAVHRRVVLVEDNADIRDTLAQLLELWGHTVLVAEDGPSGVERVLTERPDVALIDIGLPGMNGYEVAKAIRREIPDGRIRLIAVTGYGKPADRELARHAGFDAHLLKPVRPELLEQSLGA